MSKAIVNTLESLETGEQFDVRDIAQLSAGYQRQKNQIFLELRRLAAEASFNLVDGSFEEGAEISGWPDVVWYQADGKYYQWKADVAKTVAAGSTPTNIGTDWIDRTHITFKNKLKQSVLSETLSGLHGLSIAISVDEYGAIGDGTYHPLSEKFSTLTSAQVVYPLATSLSQSIDWAAFAHCIDDHAGENIHVKSGKYVITDQLNLPDFTTLILHGKCYDFVGSTMLLAYGTGTKSESIAGCTATTVANPDTGAAYLADSGTRGNTYSTIDWSVPFSAFIILGVGAGIIGGGVYPYFNGVDGYYGSDGAMADNWDLGVWARNANGWRLTDTCVEGHWRKAGLLVSASDIGGSAVPSCELGQALNCHFGGGFGVSIRTPSTATGSTNYGFAGTDFINCRLRSLNHQSAHLATSSYLTTPLSIPSGCLEIDGAVMRGIQFLNCTLITRDDILMFLANNNETLFDGCYEESRNTKVSGAWITAIGSRVVCTSGTGACQMSNNTKYGIDFSPYYPRESSVSRYTVSSDGVNNANTIYDDDYINPHYSSMIPFKLRNSTQNFTVLDKSGNHIFDLDAAGNMKPAGSLIQTGTILRTTGTTLNIQRTVSGVTTNVMSVYVTGNIELSGAALTIPSDIKPKTTNTAYCGISALAWAGGYTQTAFTVLSDENYKQDINYALEDALLDAWATVNYCEYRFKDRVITKGESARYHIGVIAQRVEEAFENAGIDPFKYGILNYDSWDAGVFEDDTAYEAGEKYSINYEEALALEAALQRRTTQRLEATLETLKARLTTLESK